MTGDLHITVIDRDGGRRDMPALAGWRVMEIIRDHGMDIVAECGGSGTCGTCHVFVDAAWQNKLPTVRDDERETLETLHAYEPHQSRLCCQVIMQDALNGLTVTLAPPEDA